MPRSSTTSIPGRIPFGVGIVVLLGLFGRVAGASGCAHPVEPGWCGRCLSCGLGPRATVRRTRRHPRALPIRLYAGVSTIPRIVIRVLMRRAVLGSSMPFDSSTTSPSTALRHPRALRQATRAVTAFYPAAGGAGSRSGGPVQKVIYRRARSCGSKFTLLAQRGVAL